MVGGGRGRFRLIDIGELLMERGFAAGEAVSRCWTERQVFLAAKRRRSRKNRRDRGPSATGFYTTDHRHDPHKCSGVGIGILYLSVKCSFLRPEGHPAQSPFRFTPGRDLRPHHLRLTAPSVVKFPGSLGGPSAWGFFNHTKRGSA